MNVKINLWYIIIIVIVVVILHIFVWPCDCSKYEQALEECQADKNKLEQTYQAKIDSLQKLLDNCEEVLTAKQGGE